MTTTHHLDTDLQPSLAVPPVASPATESGPTPLSRLTGAAYLGIVATGIFAEFAVRGSLIDNDDAVATATNIAESPGLFGIGIGADVVMILLDATVAFGLYRLLRRVDARLAIAAAVLRLIQGALLAVNMLHLDRALNLARDPGTTGNPTAAQQVLDAVERHALGYDVGLIAFGLSCLVLSRMLVGSNLVSRPLGIGMGATGVVYLIGSFAALGAPSLNTAIDPLYLIAMIVEPAFAIRLITRGLRTPAADRGLPVPQPITV
ncbi:MAG: DUF4386 domain-containing protein [Acidimicrobiales bacterium]